VLAEKLRVTARTISRRENRQTPMPLFVVPALKEILLTRHNRTEVLKAFIFMALFFRYWGHTDRF